MILKKGILTVFFVFFLGSQAFGGAPDAPMVFRLNWVPGETYQYKVASRVEAYAAGESARIQMSFNAVIRVLKTMRSGEPNPLPAGYQDVVYGEQSLALGGRLFELELRYEDFRMAIEAAGKRIDIAIDKENISGFLNNRPLPSHQMADLRREARASQEILKTPFQLLMTESGRIVSVAGLENLDQAMQKELAKKFLEGMMLPEKPMKVGDTFTDRVSLENLLPKQRGQTKHPLAGQSLEVIWTLKGMKPFQNGKTVVEFSAPIKEKLENVPLTEKGHRASVELDLINTTLFDADRGTIVRETSKGTVLLRPKDSNMPRLITVRTVSTIELNEPP